MKKRIWKIVQVTLFLYFFIFYFPPIIYAQPTTQSKITCKCVSPNTAGDDKNGMVCTDGGNNKATVFCKSGSDACIDGGTNEVNLSDEIQPKTGSSDQDKKNIETNFKGVATGASCGKAKKIACKEGADCSVGGCCAQFTCVRDNATTQKCKVKQGTDKNGLPVGTDADCSKTHKCGEGFKCIKINANTETCQSAIDLGQKNPGDAPTPAKVIPPPPPPCADFKNGKCLAINSALGNLSTEPAGFVKTLFSILLSMSGGIALLLIIKSGYMLMVSQGKPEQLNQAREQMTAAIVGLLFLIFSFVILQVIGVDILRIPTTKVQPKIAAPATPKDLPYGQAAEAGAAAGVGAGAAGGNANQPPAGKADGTINGPQGNPAQPNTQ